MVLAILATLQTALVIAAGHPLTGPGAMTLAARGTLASFGSYIAVALVVCHAGHPLLALLRTAPLVYLGTISYGIYLYHYPIVKSSEAMSRYLGVSQGPALSIIEFFLGLVVAVVSWHLIERPVMRLKDRIPYLRGPSRTRMSDRPRLRSRRTRCSLPRPRNLLVVDFMHFLAEGDLSVLRDEPCSNHA